jgi:SpoVK/Ycf46/Vps4 family AAA+-type ATPase
MPVIVFFDEMDSIFRTRGSGVSSDVENTIVPQLLSEIDGVEGLENVIVIGASNREDMIDPAILRPGRLDVKIKIERPDAEAAKDIFSKYVLTVLPLHPDDVAENENSRQSTVDAMIQRTVERMYTESEENRFLEVTYANGDKEVLYFKDFNSGAMIENIVARAKKMAIKDFLATGQKGLRMQHLMAACIDEFKRTRISPTPPTPTTGRGSPARRASGSSTSGRWSPASTEPRRDDRSTPSPTPASTCSPVPSAGAWPGHTAPGSGCRRALARRPVTRPAAGRGPCIRPRRPARCGGCAPEPPLGLPV